MMRKATTAAFLRVLLCVVFAGSLLAGCAHESDIAQRSLIATIQKKYVPDNRLGVFDVTLENGRVCGKTTSQKAKEELIKAFGEVSCDVRLLPDTEALGGKTFGFVRVPVATLYKAPSYTSSVQTQSVLGTPVRILQKDGWLQVKLPDGYVAWAVPEQIISCDEVSYKRITAREPWLVTATQTALLGKPDIASQRLGLLPAGARLYPTKKANDVWMSVELTDGTKGFICSRDIQSLTALLKHWDDLRSDPIPYAKALTRLATSLLGQSYLWGGTSTFAVDCSGFTQTVYRQTGILLPRDADMQATVGNIVQKPFLPGDLLFFGVRGDAGQPDSIRHVALSLGGDKFIHARGHVRLASFSPQDPEFDSYETERFLKAVRPNLTNLPRLTRENEHR